MGLFLHKNIDRRTGDDLAQAHIRLTRSVLTASLEEKVDGKAFGKHARLDRPANEGTECFRGAPGKLRAELGILGAGHKSGDERHGEPPSRNGDVRVIEQALLIAGPTASGKSALALAKAERHGALVVNADSMQVYRDLDVLSARPPLEDLARAPHRLYGHVDANRNYSVAAWLDDMRLVLKEAEADKRPLVIVGGTGLYFRALLGGLSPLPEIPAGTRIKWREMAEVATPGELHDALKERDPDMAERLEPGDTQRLTRALEVVDATGRSLLSWQREPGQALLPFDTPKVVLAPPRPWLHARIAERFRLMVSRGAVEEAATIVSRALAPSLPAMKAIGVRELADVASGARSLEDAIEASIVSTRRYAKRQETFFRGQLGNWPRIDPSDQVAVRQEILP